MRPPPARGERQNICPPAPIRKGHICLETPRLDSKDLRLRLRPHLACLCTVCAPCWARMKVRVAVLTLCQVSSAWGFVRPVQPSLAWSRVGDVVATNSICRSSTSGSSESSSSSRSRSSSSRSRRSSNSDGLQMVTTAPSSLTTDEMHGTDSLESTSMASAAIKSEDRRVVHLYDTTLRDGTQMEGISASVNDKLKIAKELHNFGEIATISTCTL